MTASIRPAITSFIVLSSLLVAVSQRPHAQQAGGPSCRHGANEAAAERDRRLAAVRHARAINSAQANGPRPFRQLDALGVTAPAGWVVHLVTDGRAYAFSVEDGTDPCGFVLFSDDRGVIRQGESIR